MTNLEKKYQKTLSKVRGIIEKAGRVFEGELHKIVAIDTGRLNQSIKTGSPKVKRNKISVKVGSFGVFYAKFVDKSKDVKNYHRRKKVVYTGAGQKFIARAFETKKEKIYSIITNDTRIKI